MVGQSILTVDLSSEPAIALLIDVEDHGLRVRERYASSVDLSLLEYLGKPKAEEGEVLKEGASQDPTTPTIEDPKIPLTKSLTELLSKVKEGWSNAVLIVPPRDYLSVNVPLPFGDKKKLAQILNLEMQDLVPFDIGEFLLHARSFPLPQSSNGNGAAPNGEFDIHVGLAPKPFVRELLEVCQGSGLDPMVIAPFTSMLGLLPHFFPEDFKKDICLIFADGNTWCVGCFVDGHFRYDRLVNRKDALRGDTPTPIERDIVLTIKGVERRYDRIFQGVYLLGDSLQVQNLAFQSDVPVERFRFKGVLEGGTDRECLACGAAVFAKDTHPVLPLTNFRTGEFSFGLKLKELWLGVKALFPYIGITLMVGALVLLAIYYSRSARINKMNDSLKQEILKVIPTLDLSAGDPITPLQKARDSLKEQLDNLGSPYRVSPVTTLVEITKEFPISDTVQIRHITIKRNQVTIEGNAPDYTSVEKIERFLKQKEKSNAYERVTKDMKSSVAAQGPKEFRFDIWLKEG